MNKKSATTENIDLAGQFPASRRKLNRCSAVIICLWLSGMLCFSCRSENDVAVPSASVVTDDSILTMTESGRLESMNYSVVSSPSDWRMDYRIFFLREEGSFAEQGDTVVIFDPEQAQSQMDEAQSLLALKQEKLTEIREKNALSLNQKDQAIRQLEMEIEINRDKLKNAAFESEVNRQQMALELQKTEQQLKRARLDFESQQVLNANNENLIMLEINQALVQMSRARRMMADMFLTAPRAGIVIYEKQGWGSDEEKLRPGLSVQPQTPILSIPDLRNMKAVVRLNEVDRPGIRDNLHAIIRVEAYPDTLFTGRIASVSRIVNYFEGSRNVKTYDVDVVLNSGENYRLKPGLTAQITIFADTLQQVFRVPVWCLESENSKNYVIPDYSGRIDVSVVARMDGYAFVRGKLNPGMILADMKLPDN